MTSSTDLCPPPLPDLEPSPVLDIDYSPAAEARRQYKSPPLLESHVPGSSATAEGRPFAVDGFLIDGAMTLIAGSFKNGKSTLSTELAVSLATGTSLFGLDAFPVLTPPSRVLVMQTENSDARVDRDLIGILEARGLDADWGRDISLVSQVALSGFNLLRNDHFNMLTRDIEMRGYRWIVLDPIHHLIGDVNISTWDNAPAITRRLTQLRDSGCTPIITIPFKAGDQPMKFDSILGSAIFGGWMETGVLVKRASNERDFTIKVDFRRDRAENALRDYKLRGLGVGRWELPSASAPTPKDAADRPAKAPTGLDAYREFITEHPNATKTEIAAAIGCHVRSVERYARAS